MATPDPDWSAFIRGDRDAFERVYRAHGPALLRYGAQFAEADVVEDRTQDLFVRLWQRRERLKPDVVVRAYLLVSLRNALFRSKSVAGRTDSIEDAAVTAAGPTAEDQLIASEVSDERASSLASAIDQLAPRERELVTLRFDQGLDYEDISEITGLNYQVARNTLSRAIKKLRKYLSVLIFWAVVVTKLHLGYSLIDGTPL